MTKSQNGMFTRSIIYLARDAFPVIVIKSTFPLLPLGRYVLLLTTLNIYPEVAIEIRFFLLHLRTYIYFQTLSIFGNHPTSGLCHDSLNLVKFICVKLNCVQSTHEIQLGMLPFLYQLLLILGRTIWEEFRHQICTHQIDNCILNTQRIWKVQIRSKYYY